MVAQPAHQKGCAMSSELLDALLDQHPAPPTPDQRHSTADHAISAPPAPVAPAPDHPRPRASARRFARFFRRRRAVARPYRRWYASIGVLLGDIGGWLLIAAWALFLFVVNGGFSVAGAEQIMYLFGPYGQLVWEIISKWTVTLPFTAPDLSALSFGTAPTARELAALVNGPRIPVVIPVLPWAGVVGSTFVQVGYLVLKLTGQPIPTRLQVAMSICSLYDFVTTFFGTRSLAWLVAAGVIPQGIVSAVLTFGFEGTVAALIARNIPEPEQEQPAPDRPRRLVRMKRKAKGTARGMV